MDAVAKWLVGADYSPVQIIAVRGWILVAALLASLSLRGALTALRTARAGAHVARATAGVSAPLCFFWSLEHLPLAEATAIFFSATFIMTALSAWLLREAVGTHRWAAVLIGFIGVLVVTRPGSGAFQTASLLALASSLGYSILVLSGRWLSKTESTLTLVFYFNLVTTVLTTVMLPLVWRPMALVDMLIIVVMSALALAGHMLLTGAFRLAPIGVIAPFEYSALVWSVLIGFLVWGDVPGPVAALGIGIILASGLYIANRERLDHRRLVAERASH
jgi:drug/metabolite transporter (DMT)-like permease